MIPLQCSRGAASFLLRLLSYFITAVLILAGPQIAARAQADDPGLRWTLEVSVPAAGQTARQLRDDLSARLGDPAVGVEVSAQGSAWRARLSGSGIDSLRQALYTAPGGQAPGNGLEVRLTAPAARGQQLALTLDANITTGYAWDWAALDPAHFTLVGQAVTQSPAAPFRLGAPQRVTATLEAAADGELTAALAYRRPWRADAAPARLSIQADALPATLDLSNPNPPTSAGLELTLSGPQPSPQQETPIQPQSLPASFDWRALGKVSAVRDQGNCGSCWAFGVVGVLESAVKVQLNGAEKDLSEQFLVNCNSYRYDCGGGWFSAHDFHYDSVRAPQVEPGSVNESQLPYTAANGTCTVNYAKGYRLSRWQYINYETPDITAIKEAILSYGPVGVGVCVGDAFANYGGGIFATNETCGSAVVNHAVVLVGWDDSTQSWIMKNSWDTWWGEDGYMRIRYGTSQIGFWANYVVVQSISPAPLTPAAGAVAPGLRPEFTWEAVGDALDYQLQLSATSGFSTLLVDVSVNGLAYTPGADLPPNSLAYWRVRARMNSGYSVWSTARALKTLPATPVPASPRDGARVTGLRPSFTWTQTVTVTKVEVQVSALADFSQLAASGSSTSLTWTPTTDLPRDAALLWRARAVGAYGASAWSAPGAAFTTLDPPLPPVPSAPATGTLLAAAAHPNFSWNPPAVSIPAGYHIQFARASSFAEVLTEADVTGASYTFAGALPPNGPLYWRVSSYNGDPRQNSAYSATRAVKILPDVPPLVSPVGVPAISLRPTLSWQPGANKPTYDLQVSKLSTCGSPFQTLTASASSTFTFSADLARLTSYYWRVRARGTYGISAWSVCQIFTTPDPPSVPALVAPATGAVLPAAAGNRPTFTWKVSSNRPEGYIVQIWKGSSYNAATMVQQVVNDPAQTSLTWPEPLAYGAYSWRVRSFGAGPAYSNWSSPRIIKTPAGVQGTVTEYGVGAAAGVKVAVSGTTLYAITDANGVYLLPAIPAGERKLVFSGASFVTQSKTLTFSAGSLRTVNATVQRK